MFGHTGLGMLICRRADASTYPELRNAPLGSSYQSSDSVHEPKLNRST
jgi:hypothetical protein